jgi:hypothetical protein
MIKRSGFLILVSLLAAAAFSQTQVVLIPTIHGLHRTNRQYNYDSLKAIVKQINPDVIAVEIRSIEVNADTNYLKKNYPYEMWMMRYWFPQTHIEGFDWLGDDLEGRQIPERYWQEQSNIKRLEQQLDKDSIYSKKFGDCNRYTRKRLEILGKNALKEILNSDDAFFVINYYECMQQQLSGSIYEQLPNFYNRRNKEMETRLNAIIQKHQNKKIIVLTGDDHYPYLLEYLKTTGVQLLKL